MLRKYKKYLMLLIGLVVIIAIFLFGATSGYFYFKKSNPQTNQTIIEGKDTYTAFLLETYDKIKENYWDTLSEAELNNYFKLGSEKLVGGSYTLKPNSKKGLEKMLNKILADLNQEQKKEFSVALANIVLQNLQPIGRSGLYTTQDEQALKNRVENIHPESDLYADLGLGENASQQEIEKAYQEKIALLEKNQSPEAQIELKKTKYAYQVLSDPKKKQRYDQTGAEPTVFGKLVRPNIFYLHIQKFSPVSFEEFQNETKKVDNIEGLDTLILDLRGNVGGSIDILPYFLGPFIGYDQYAYELLHQGERTPFKTKVGWLNSLVRYKKVVILIDSQTQSTAELMASVLKRYNVGVLVGERTKGWGTIERVFELKNQISPDEKYSIFLVHTLTLRDDNKPIEGNGIEPVISINSSNWKKQLLAYFNHQELVKAVEEIWHKDPNSFY
jgi:C-terminal processing protease CtpA/Prc